MLSISKLVRLRTLIWLAAAGLTLVIFYVCPYRSEVVEQLYSRGLFKVYRFIWDHTLALSPIPLIYLVITGAVLYQLGLVPSWKSKVHPRSKSYRFVHRLIRLICFAVVIFYWCWGFNYKRSSLNSLLGLGSDQPHEAWLRETYCDVSLKLVELRDGLGDVEVEDIYVSEEELREALEQKLQAIGLPVAGEVRARKIRPKGSLLHLSTAGVYLPWAGEGHIDKGLHPITHPFTMIHEMSHGYGWTGEDECNFLALIAAISSENEWAQYSGYFGYWRYLRYQLFVVDREVFDQMYRAGDEVIMRDYEDILAYSRQYKEILPELRDIFYDTYLKSHGISSGLVNYNQMIRLAYRWEQTHGSLR